MYHKNKKVTLKFSLNLNQIHYHSLLKFKLIKAAFEHEVKVLASLICSKIKNKILKMKKMRKMRKIFKRAEKIKSFDQKIDELHGK